jgi:hypothetical protein
LTHVSAVKAGACEFAINIVFSALGACFASSIKSALNEIKIETSVAIDMGISWIEIVAVVALG